MKKNLTREERLRKRKDIENAFRFSKNVSCYGLKLIFKENDLDKNINGDTQVDVSDNKNENYEDDKEKESFFEDEIKIEPIESIEELYEFKNTSFA